MASFSPNWIRRFPSKKLGPMWIFFLFFSWSSKATCPRCQRQILRLNPIVSARKYPDKHLKWGGQPGSHDNNIAALSQSETKEWGLLHHFHDVMSMAFWTDSTKWPGYGVGAWSSMSSSYSSIPAVANPSIAIDWLIFITVPEARENNRNMNTKINSDKGK